jgi:hypothetical protein
VTAIYAGVDDMQDRTTHSGWISSAISTGGFLALAIAIGFVSVIWSGAEPPGTSCTYVDGGSSCSYPDFDPRVLAAWVSLLAAPSLFIVGWQLGNRRRRPSSIDQRSLRIYGIRILDGRTLGKGGLVLMAMLAFGTAIFIVINLAMHPFPTGD